MMKSFRLAQRNSALSFICALLMPHCGYYAHVSGTEVGNGDHPETETVPMDSAGGKSLIPTSLAPLLNACDTPFRADVVGPIQLTHTEAGQASVLSATLADGVWTVSADDSKIARVTPQADGHSAVVTDASSVAMDLGYTCGAEVTAVTSSGATTYGRVLTHTAEPQSTVTLRWTLTTEQNMQHLTKITYTDESSGSVVEWRK